MLRGRLSLYARDLFWRKKIDHLSIIFDHDQSAWHDRKVIGGRNSERAAVSHEDREWPKWRRLHQASDLLMHAFKVSNLAYLAMAHVCTTPVWKRAFGVGRETYPSKSERTSRVSCGWMIASTQPRAAP